MAGFLEERSCLFRFLSVIHFVGTSFLKLCSFTSVVERYVCGEMDQIVPVGKRKSLMAKIKVLLVRWKGFCFRCV